jgi:type IV pilus assembly protein PilW
VITDANNGPDTISVFYGSDNERILSMRLQFGMNDLNADVQIDGTAGFEPGNIVLLQKGAVCPMVQVTSSNASALKHDPVAAYKWNLTGGLVLPGGNLPGPTGAPVSVNWYDNSSLLFNLGSTPNWKTYGLRIEPDGTPEGRNTGRLQLTDQFRLITENLPSQDVMDGIFDLQAQYGKDNNGDNVVDEWTKCITTCGPTPPLPTEVDWIKVIAIRVAVLARSDEYIKPATAGGACEATTAANRPTWSGGAFFALDKPGTLPSCYKYRVFETTVPLRNMLWRPA